MEVIKETRKGKAWAALAPGVAGDLPVARSFPIVAASQLHPEEGCGSQYSQCETNSEVTRVSHYPGCHVIPNPDTCMLSLRLPQMINQNDPFQSWCLALGSTMLCKVLHHPWFPSMHVLAMVPVSLSSKDAAEGRGW